MFFYLDYRFSPDSGAVRTQVFDSAEPAFPETNTLYLQTGRQRLISIDTPASKLVLMGDPVFGDRESLGNMICTNRGTVNEAELYAQVRGHYYWFLLTKNELRCGTSFGAIFPVYYQIQNDRAYICSASFFLAEKTGAETRDRRNLLERLLFNYPFFNSTWWTGIHLLDAHRHLYLSGQGASVGGNFAIHDYFGTGTNDSRESLEQLAGLFESESSLFLPDTPFGISFTGGFDGRTLVASAMKAGRTDFTTYSFGRPGTEDVTFPAAQTRQLGIPYTPILLDRNYLEHHALESAFAFMRRTENNGNLGRPHYHYAARLLAEKMDYILTGNFGSEMFRALHQPGVMMTENLIRLFAATDNSWKDALKTATREWNAGIFSPELDALIADLEIYLTPMQSWEPNHKFYHFVFNEIFRKYFGPELVMQSHYLNNRTPYLSLPFFRALNDTVWSGVHSRLFEKQKNKRMKGQMFYAAFIRRAEPRLYHRNTSKGYSPADVLERWRLPLLLGKVGLKKYLATQETDSNSENTFLLNNCAEILNRIEKHDDAIIQTSGIAKRLTDAIGKKDIERIIKISSIATGWASANARLVT